MLAQDLHQLRHDLTVARQSGFHPHLRRHGKVAYYLCFDRYHQRDRTVCGRQNKHSSPVGNERPALDAHLIVIDLDS